MDKLSFLSFVCVFSCAVAFQCSKPKLLQRRSFLSAENAVDYLKESGFSKFYSLLAKVPAICGPVAENTEKYTIFAPSAAAFAKLDKGIADKLADPRNLDVVDKIVAYHVVRGKMTEEDIYKERELATMGEGESSLKVTTAKTGGMFGMGGKDDGFRINDAKIIKSTEFPNSIVHEVDALLSPYLLYRFLWSG
jgi:uncharacterized surface protein with fasciclin (FAS1) repeats